MLWRHECTRVFADRFIFVADKKWFDKEILKLIETELGAELRKKAEVTPVFVDFMRYLLFL